MPRASCVRRACTLLAGGWIVAALLLSLIGATAPAASAATEPETLDGAYTYTWTRTSDSGVERRTITASLHLVRLAEHEWEDAGSQWTATGLVESQGHDAVVARFAGWFADLDTVEVMSAMGEPVADRLLVHYQLGLRRGTTHWTCTQTLICKTAGDRLATIDLLCSGFREINETGTGAKGDDGA